MTDRSSASEDRRRLLELDYKTAFEAWRQMVDIRFKLLALLPVATVVGVSQKLPYGASVAGLMFIVGLSVYEIRNTQIHDALAKRLVELEGLLGGGALPQEVRAQTFSGRPQVHLRAFGLVKLWHNRSIGIIYGASAAAWTWRLCSSWPPIPPVLSAASASIVGLLFHFEMIRLSRMGR